MTQRRISLIREETYCAERAVDNNTYLSIMTRTYRLQ